MLKTITSPAKQQKLARSTGDGRKAIKSAVRSPASTWIELYRATRAMVCPLLDAVHKRLEDEGNAESAYHLSALVIEILNSLDLEDDSAITPEDGAIYRVHALVRSAMSTSGEVLDDVSTALITQAYAAVNAMMEAMTANPTVAQIRTVKDALAKVPQGVDSNDGTAVGRAEIIQAPIVIGAIQTESLTDHTHSPACLASEAVVVIKAAAMELDSAMVWGLHSLSKVVSAATDLAWDDISPPNDELLADASAQLDELLALFEAVNNDGMDCMLLYAAESLLNSAKVTIDAKYEELQ